jgi:putative colanic acid biosynthesis glycosyltransferase
VTGVKNISIIIPVFNDPIALQKTLSSIRSVNYDIFEVIIMDGGSTDSTLEVIKANDDIITYWSSEPDEGEYDAMNKGIAVATGKGLLFVMAGDYFKSPFSCNNIPVPSFLNVEKLLPNGNTKSIKIKSFKMGLPNCHQGIVFENNKNNKFDLSYKVASDYNYYLDFDYGDTLSVVCDDCVLVYDEGYSGINSVQRDNEIYAIIKNNFSTHNSLAFLFMMNLKRIVKCFLRR